MMRHRPISFIVAALLTTGTVACNGTDGSNDDGPNCEGPEILPSISPLNLGEMYPPPDDRDPDPGNSTRAPVERSILLESKCRKTLNIRKTCLVGDTDGGGNDAEQFDLEGPSSTEIPSETKSAVRLTYERSNPNSGDDVDDAALVVQSDAKTFKTLVIPVCARVVSEDSDRSEISCTSPVEAPPEGERKTGLCSN